MSIAIQISFRGINKSAAVESAIRQHAARLERFAPRIKRLHVAVGMPQHNRHHGNHYAVRIEIATLSGEPFVTHDAPHDDSHKDFQTVLRDTFDAAERHLEGGDLEAGALDGDTTATQNPVADLSPV